MTKRRVLPISPQEVIQQKKNDIPDEALEAFNELIARNWNGNESRVPQKDVVALMIKKGLNNHDIFNNGWLNVEDIYRARTQESDGWEVEYDKPGYNESYEAYFIFRPKIKK